MKTKVPAIPTRTVKLVDEPRFRAVVLDWMRATGTSYRRLASFADLHWSSIHSALNGDRPVSMKLAERIEGAMHAINAAGRG